MAHIMGMVLIVLGLIFDVFGCVGLIRLPDVYSRIQAAVKCVTLGTCLIMFGAVIYVGFWTATGVKAIFAILFVLLTAPVAAHAIARAAHKSGVRIAEDQVCDHYAKDNESEK